MSRLDVMVRLSDGAHDAELVKSGRKRSWVKLHHDKNIIKVRNSKLTIGLGALSGNDGLLVTPSGSLRRVDGSRGNRKRPGTGAPDLSKDLHTVRRRG